MLVLLKQNRLLCLRYGIVAFCFVNFACISLGISNITPLLSMAILGVLCFFMPDRVKPSGYTMYVLAVFLYLIGMDAFYYTETSGFGFLRRAIYGFFAGIAVCYALRQSKQHFTYQVNICVVFLLLLVPGSLLLWGDASPLLSYKTGGFKFLSKHHTIFAVAPAFGVIAGLSMLCSRYAKPGRVAGVTDDYLRLPGLLENLRRFAVKPGIIVAVTCVMIVALLLSFSRITIFAAAVACLFCFGPRLMRMIGVKKCLGIVLAFVFVVSVGYALAPSSWQTKRMFESRILESMADPLNTATLKSRYPAWDSGIAAGKQCPLFGHGMNSFELTHAGYMEENYDRWVAVLGKTVVDCDTKRLMHAHSQYISLFAELGIVGCALFAVMLLYPLLVAFRYRTFFGTLVPNLVFVLLYFLAEAPFYSNFGLGLVTILFMSLGYFSVSKERFERHGIR